MFPMLLETAATTAGGDCGLRDRASALAHFFPGRYTMSTSLIPEPYTRVHHLACFPEGLGAKRTALTAA